MKHLALLLIGTFFSSCSDNAGDIGSDDDTFTAIIDDGNYNISGRYAWAEQLDEDLFVVYGSEDQAVAGFRNVFISFIGKPEADTYDFTDPTQVVGTLVDTGNNDTYNTALAGASGEVTVSEISETRIKGIFSFFAPKVDDSGLLSVENGTFDVRIGFE